MTEPVTPTLIPALPDPPDTDDPANFDERADEFFSRLYDQFQPAANAQAEDNNTNATAAKEKADAAAASATLSRDWATSLSVVSGGLYGARKYSNDASGFADDAAASATLALNAPATFATSASSLSATAGSKSVVLQQTGKPFAPNMWVMVYRTSDITKKFRGPITAVSNLASGPNPTITVNATFVSGGGPYTDWAVIQIPEPVADIASQAEAEAGTVTDKLMTPQRTKQAIDALSKSAPDVIIQDQKTTGAASQTFAANNTWYARELNTVVRNAGTLATLSSNAVTLGPGTWMIRARAAFATTAALRLRDTTNGVTLAYAENQPAPGVAHMICAEVVLAGSAAIEIQQQVVSGGQPGAAANSISGQPEVYATLEATRIR